MRGLIGGVMVWVAAAFGCEGQVAVRFSMVDMTGQALNKRVTVQGLQSLLAPAAATNVWAGFPIVLWPTNGVAVTNLVSADYTVSIDGLGKRWTIRVPTNAGPGGVWEAAALALDLVTYTYTNPIVQGITKSQGDLYYDAYGSAARRLATNAAQFGGNAATASLATNSASGMNIDVAIFSRAPTNEPVLSNPTLVNATNCIREEHGWALGVWGEDDSFTPVVTVDDSSVITLRDVAMVRGGTYYADGRGMSNVTAATAVSVPGPNVNINFGANATTNGNQVTVTISNSANLLGSDNIWSGSNNFSGRAAFGDRVIFSGQLIGPIANLTNLDGSHAVTSSQVGSIISNSTAQAATFLLGGATMSTNPLFLGAHFASASGQEILSVGHNPSDNFVNLIASYGFHAFGAVDIQGALYSDGSHLTNVAAATASTATNWSGIANSNNYSGTFTSSGTNAFAALGIGTASPKALLHVVTSGAANNVKLDNSGGSSVTGLSLANSGTIQGYWALASQIGNFSSSAQVNDMVFRSESNNILFLRGTGSATMSVGTNVTIGTNGLIVNGSAVIGLPLVITNGIVGISNSWNDAYSLVLDTTGSSGASFRSRILQRSQSGIANYNTLSDTGGRLWDYGFGGGGTSPYNCFFIGTNGYYLPFLLLSQAGDLILTNGNGVVLTKSYISSGSNYFGGNVTILDKPKSAGTYTVETSLMVNCKSNNGGVIATPSSPVLTLARDGVSGQSYPNFAELKLRRYDTNSSYSRTELSVGLTHGNNDQSTTDVMSWRSDKTVLFSGSAFVTNGSVISTNFIGSGSGLSNLPAAQLTGRLSRTNLPAIRTGSNDIWYVIGDSRSAANNWGQYLTNSIAAAGGYSRWTNYATAGEHLTSGPGFMYDVTNLTSGVLANVPTNGQAGHLIYFGGANDTGNLLDSWYVPAVSNLFWACYTNNIEVIAVGLDQYTCSSSYGSYRQTYNQWLQQSPLVRLYVDTWSTFANCRDPRLYLTDNLHFTATGYRQIARMLEAKMFSGRDAPTIPDQMPWCQSLSLSSPATSSGFRFQQSSEYPTGGDTAGYMLTRGGLVGTNGTVASIYHHIPYGMGWSNCILQVCVVPAWGVTNASLLVAWNTETMNVTNATVSSNWEQATAKLDNMTNGKPVVVTILNKFRDDVSPRQSCLALYSRTSGNLTNDVWLLQVQASGY